MGVSQQEYCSGLAFPPPGIFPIQGLKLHLLWLLHWQVDSLPLGWLGSPCNKWCSDKCFEEEENRILCSKVAGKQSLVRKQKWDYTGGSTWMKDRENIRERPSLWGHEEPGVGVTWCEWCSRGWGWPKRQREGYGDGQGPNLNVLWAVNFILSVNHLGAFWAGG